MTAELVSELASAELTYHSAGATKATLPTGYHYQNAARVIGSGAEAFGTAAGELLSWQAHLRAGLRVTASTATAEPGTVVLLGIGVGPLRMRAPCRVKVENLRGWLPGDGLVMLKCISENGGRRSNGTSVWRRTPTGQWQIFHHQGMHH